MPDQNKNLDQPKPQGDESLQQEYDDYAQELLNNAAWDSAVYVFKKDGFVSAAYPELVCYEYGDYVVGVKQK